MSLLLNKGKIGDLELKNRVVMPPMCMYKSDNSGELKDFHMFHYTSRAMADVGLIIVEATSVEPKGRISSKSRKRQKLVQSLDNSTKICVFRYIRFASKSCDSEGRYVLRDTAKQPR